MRTNLLIQLFIIGLFLCVGGCDDDNDDNFAPDFLSGRIYRFVITEATGLSTPLTALGAFRMAFQAEETCVVMPETENFSPFEGAYIYTKRERNSGELTFMLMTSPEEVTYTGILWFTTSISGDYVGMLRGDSSWVGLFSGTFQQI